MANQDKANVFSVVSSHKVPDAKYLRHEFFTELYCQVNNRKKLRKALRRVSGEKK
ncbi:hypothetical protein QI593_004659 [Salmonella enterica]|nr:hypothetical protein [Salmonella enterica]ELD8279907.1 hypothetical protein [Salmonella enterica]